VTCNVGEACYAAASAVSSISSAYAMSVPGKARRELGWTHPAADEMWDRIVAEERALMDRRKGFLERLRQQAVVEG
jgi:hypothetical protein